MSWEIVLITAFNTVGLIEYVKGFFKQAPTWVWRLAQIVAVFLMALIINFASIWVVTGVTALSVSQIGYDVIVDSIKKRLKAD